MNNFKKTIPISLKSPLLNKTLPLSAKVRKADSNLVKPYKNKEFVQKVEELGEEFLKAKCFHKNKKNVDSGTKLSSLAVPEDKYCALSDHTESLLPNNLESDVYLGCFSDSSIKKRKISKLEVQHYEYMALLQDTNEKLEEKFDHLIEITKDIETKLNGDVHVLNSKVSDPVNTIVQNSKDLLRSLSAVSSRVESRDESDNSEVCVDVQNVLWTFHEQLSYDVRKLIQILPEKNEDFNRRFGKEISVNEMNQNSVEVNYAAQNKMHSIEEDEKSTTVLDFNQTTESFTRKISTVRDFDELFTVFSECEIDFPL